MRIGILGSGLMGGKLGTLFARAGHEVVFSYARTREAGDAGARGRERAGGHAARGRAGGGRAPARRALVADRRRAGAGRRSVGQGGRDLLAADERRRQRARRRPTRRRAPRSWRRRSAARASYPRSAPCRARCCSRCSRPGAGPRRVSSTAGTTRSQGGRRDADPRRRFDPVDAGPLAVARYTEPFTLLVAQLAYEGDEGPELAYRFERYEERS